MRRRRFEGEEEKSDQIVLTACCSCGARFSRDCGSTISSIKGHLERRTRARTF